MQFFHLNLLQPLRACLLAPGVHVSKVVGGGGKAGWLKCRNNNQHTVIQWADMNELMFFNQHRHVCHCHPIECL